MRRLIEIWPALFSVREERGQFIDKKICREYNGQ